MTEKQSNAQGWIVTFSALSINLVLGALYAWGVMGKALVVKEGWTRTDSMIPNIASTIAFAISMIFAGRMQDKIGPRKVVILGGLLLGVGFITSAWAKSPWVMMITYGLIGGTGIGIGYSATTPPSLKWFPPQMKGLIAGIVVSGVGLAAVYMAPLTRKLLTVHTIPQTFIILGIFIIVIVLVMSSLIKNPPAGYVPAAVTNKSTAASPKKVISRPDLNWPQMLQTSAFWRLWITMALGTSVGLMMIFLIPQIAKSQAKIEDGAQFVMILAIFNTLGRLMSGVISDKLGRTNTIVLCFALQAINLFFFRTYTTYPLLALGTACAGFFYGPIFALFPTATADFFGLKNLGVNFGIMFTSFGVGGTLGPLVGARIADKTGGVYDQAYIIFGIMLVVGVVLAITTRPPKIAKSEA